MPAHNPGQLEHRHLPLAEDGQQLGVGVHGAFVGGVLQALSLDVVPQLFDDLRARDLFGADHGGQYALGFNSNLTSYYTHLLPISLACVNLRQICSKIEQILQEGQIATYE